MTTQVIYTMKKHNIVKGFQGIGSSNQAFVVLSFGGNGLNIHFACCTLCINHACHTCYVVHACWIIKELKAKSIHSSEHFNLRRLHLRSYYGIVM